MIRFGLTCGIKKNRNSYNASRLSGYLKHELRKLSGIDFRNEQGNIVSVNGISYYIHGSDIEKDPTFTLDVGFLIERKKMDRKPFKVLLFHRSVNGGFKYFIIDKNEMKLTLEPIKNAADNDSVSEMNYSEFTSDTGRIKCYLTFLNSEKKYIKTFPSTEHKQGGTLYFSVDAPSASEAEVNDITALAQILAQIKLSS